MQRITLHVPELLSDGSPVPLELYEPHENELLDIVIEAKAATGIGEEGFSISLNVIGVWRSLLAGRQREPMRLYWFDVADAQIVLERVLRLADRIRQELDQEAVYVTVSPIEATVVTELVVA